MHSKQKSSMSNVYIINNQIAVIAIIAEVFVWSMSKITVCQLLGDRSL